ncbi:MAG: phasin family protein [Rhodospirillaceae bacterium]
MYQASEQLMALNKAQLEAAARFAGVALQGAEKIMELQFQAAKSAFADGLENARALAAVKDLQELAALKDNIAQPSIEKATSYAKSMYEAAVDTQAQFGALIEQQIADFNKQVVTLVDRLVQDAPTGSEAAVNALKTGIAAVNAAYENLAKLTKQFTETAQANIDTASRQAANEAKKASKKAA